MPHVAAAFLFRCEDFAATHDLFDWWPNFQENHTEAHTQRCARTHTHSHTTTWQPGGVIKVLFCFDGAKYLWTGPVTGFIDSGSGKKLQ